MKRNHFLLLLLCTLFFHSLFGQTNFPLENSAAMDAFYKKTTSRPRLTGKLTHYTPADKALVMNYYLSIPYSESRIEDTIQIADDGSFEIPAHQAFPNQEVVLYIVDYYISVFLDQGLRVEVDMEELKKNGTNSINKALTFSGSDAPMNVYMSNYATYTNQHPDSSYYTFDTQLYNPQISIEERLTLLNNSMDTQKALEASFIKEHGDTYAWIIRNERLSKYYHDIILKVFLYYSTAIKKSVMPPDSLLQQILAHQPLLTSDAGIRYYRNIHFFLNLKNQQTEKIKIYHLSPEKVELIMLCRDQGTQLDKKIKCAEETIPYLQSYWAKDSQAKKLKELNSDNDQIVQKVKKAAIVKNTERPYGTLVADFDFGAQLYTSNLTNIDSLINHIRALNPGKAIILDIWTVWCGPCSNDMKNSVESKKQLKEGGVEVVYLCLENSSTPEKWQKVVAKNAVAGTYFYLNTDQTAQISKKFDIDFYPTFLLFNKAGVVYPKFPKWISGLTVDMLKDKL